MILCLDVGNSNIFGGIFENEKLKLRFRHVTQHGDTSDQLGIFLKTVLRENNISGTIKQIAICSVVPSMDYSLTAACKKYFALKPFMLRAQDATGIKNYEPGTGADLVADNLAAVHRYPQQNIIIIDFGTATTVTALTQKKEYLGTAILSGIRTSMQALQNNTAKLPSVEILKPQTPVSNLTIAGIQAGLYYGHLGAIREITNRIIQQYFKHKKPVIIGTGGFAHLFEQENIFDIVIPDLVLEGLKIALKKF